MPATRIVFYQEEDGHVPLLKWLEHLRVRSQIKILQKIALLSDKGHELRRPHADILRDGIYELRAVDNDLQLRIFYFFTGREVLILSHGMIKTTDAIPASEIDRAVERKMKLLLNPDKHTYSMEG